ncbi:gibberellin 20 oxidase 1-like [Mercurialis annua]|uniref:gibberellin 20 oxidase 1-like n=1 Tax=Mercurialis annua TaxID=3986 RepID=UPI0021601B89|nr:gibberellin 20 oxidase 1-like [Mercurialis annua]
MPNMSMPLPLELLQQIDYSKIEKELFVSDAAILEEQSGIPSQFIWPEHEKPCLNCPELAILPIDLGSFLSRDPQAVQKASELVNEACRKHGFFQVLNHGVDLQLIDKAHEYMDMFFGLPLSKKQRVQRKSGERYGYASSFTSRFSSRLPWKETLTLHFSAENQSKSVKKYFSDTTGDDFKQFGNVFQEYCEAMNSLALEIMELLGTCLGVGREYCSDFFKETDCSMLRLSYYPRCQRPDLTLGTASHCDPTSLTILHQDDVGGLQVFMDKKWHSVRPDPSAFVVNIGDTFMALSNGVYKSCLHRAVVNKERARKSVAFFLSPKMDKVVKPPNKLLDSGSSRRYPDFTYSTMEEFLHKHYTAPDMKTLHVFTTWLQHQNHSEGTNSEI